MMIRKRSHINHTPCCAHLCANGAPVQLLGQCRAFKCSFELLVNCHLFTYSKIGLSWIQSESVKARTAIRTWSAIAIPDFQFGSACSYHSTFMRTFVLPILFFQRFFLIFHFLFLLDWIVAEKKDRGSGPQATQLLVHSGLVLFFTTIFNLCWANAIEMWVDNTYYYFSSNIQS